MKEELIKILDLGADATEADIVKTVGKLAATNGERLNLDARERAISAKIVESHGALNREQAIAALDNQAAADAAAKKKGKTK